MFQFPSNIRYGARNAVKIDRVKKMIDWYFNCSASAMGISSGFYAMINSSPGNQLSTNPENIIHFLSKIRRHRKIHQALIKLSKADYRMMTSLYVEEYQHRYPKLLKQIFAERTGLALCLTYDLEALLKLASKWYHHAMNEQETAELNAIIKLTNDTYDKLHRQLQFSSSLVELDHNDSLN
jgi:hypothetical protein